MLTSITFSVIWFFLFVMIHVVCFHFRPPCDRFKLIARIFFGTVVGMIVSLLFIQYAYWTDDVLSWRIIFDLFIGLAMMRSLFVLYMPFYFVIATSLSIQTLNILRQSPSGVLSIERLRKYFATEEIIIRRLHTMVANNYLIENKGVYRLTPKGVFIARAFGTFKWLWRLGAGG